MDISHKTLVDANSLRGGNAQKRQIREYVVEILRRINFELKTAHQEGRQELITELPIIFNIANLSEISAQREVWSNVIECLKLKNYRVAINPRKDNCLLKIAWFSKEDEAAILHQKNIIAMHTQTF